MAWLWERVGGWRICVLRPREDSGAENFDLMTAHKEAPAEYDFAEIIDLTGDKATVRWMDGSGIETLDYRI